MAIVKFRSLSCSHGQTKNDSLNYDQTGHSIKMKEALIRYLCLADFVSPFFYKNLLSQIFILLHVVYGILYIDTG